MRIGIIGKFPPIEGGVSTRTYWMAHALAARGHDLHVITNAKEATSPFRMHMRDEDWRRCGAEYSGGGVTVHWTDPPDLSQFYIPMASPFVAKLAGLAARVHASRPFDVIYSHYLEPYGVAAHLAAQMAGRPHVVRLAGSDAGRLWRHPQLEMLYDHVLRSAAIVATVGPVAERAVSRGVDRRRIIPGGGFAVPEAVFAPQGRVLDPMALKAEAETDSAIGDASWGGLPPGMPYFGVYGKLGESKGSFALLAALAELKRGGLDVGLVALAHGRFPIEERFRATARELGIADRVLQLPFLPNWRVPEFLRGCLAVCCLEQGFPIAHHAPIMAREVLLSGACLVASTEMIRKLPDFRRLPHGYGCVAVENVSDEAALGEVLAGIVTDPQPRGAVGARGRAFARSVQENARFPEAVEQLLEAAAAGRPGRTRRAQRQRAVAAAQVEDRFRLTRMAAAALAYPVAEGELELQQARELLVEIERRMAAGADLCSITAAVRIEIAIASAEEESDSDCQDDPLFRLRSARWAVTEEEIMHLRAMRSPNLRLVEFADDASEYLGVASIEQFPAEPAPGPSYAVAFVRGTRQQREPLLVDEATARILQLSDGRRTVNQIIAELVDQSALDMASKKEYANWIEGLFVNDLIWLSDQ